jgi:hypothetical protein
VLGDELAELGEVEVLVRSIGLKEQGDLSTATESSATRILNDLESVSVRLRLENPLLVRIGGLGGDGDAVGNEEGRVETESCTKGRVSRREEGEKRRKTDRIVR